MVSGDKEIRILGIDPGLTAGICFSIDGDIVQSYFIEANADWPIAARLCFLEDEIRHLILTTRPTHIALEDVAVVRPPKGKFQKNNFSTPGIYTLILVMVYRMGIPLILLTPSEVKKDFTDNGKAGKEEMLEMANASCGFRIKNHNQADAFAIERTAYKRLTL